MSAVGRAGKEGFWSIRGAGEKKGGGGRFWSIGGPKVAFPPHLFSGSEMPRATRTAPIFFSAPQRRGRIKTSPFSPFFTPIPFVFPSPEN